MFPGCLEGTTAMIAVARESIPAANTIDPPSAHAVAAAALPTERLQVLADQIQREKTNPALTRSQRDYVADLLSGIEMAIADELSNREEGQ